MRKSAFLFQRNFQLPSMPAPAQLNSRSSPQVLPFIHPLDDFYAQARCRCR